MTGSIFTPKNWEVNVENNMPYIDGAICIYCPYAIKNGLKTYTNCREGDLINTDKVCLLDNFLNRYKELSNYYFGENMNKFIEEIEIVKNKIIEYRLIGNK